MFCTLVSSISLLTNKYCNCKSSFAFSVEKPGNKNRRTTHFILKVLLPLRRWVWIAISHWPLLSLCKGSLNIRAATSSGTLISPLQFWLYNVWAAVAAYSCFYKSCLCWESPEWTGTPQKSLWVCAICPSPGWWQHSHPQAPHSEPCRGWPCNTHCVLRITKLLWSLNTFFRERSFFIPSVSKRLPHVPPISKSIFCSGKLLAIKQKPKIL